MKKYLIVGVSLAMLVLGVIGQLVDYRTYFASSLTCKMGRLQSPINLKDQESRYNATVFPTYFSYLPIPNAVLKFGQDGRILKVVEQGGFTSMDNYGYIGLQRGGVLKQYVLKSIEINYPAEHTIEGDKMDLEVKLIHEKVIPFQTTVNQFRRIPDANTVLVISLLFKRGSKIVDNGFINDILSTWRPSGSNVAPSSINLDILSFDLIKNRQFYFYEGSQTSEPCNENVNYIVIKDVFRLSEEAYSMFDSIYRSIYISAQASKDISPLYGRPVYRNFVLNGTEAASSFIQFSSLLIFALIAIFIF